MCPHTDRKVFSKGRCRSCAMIIYAQNRKKKLQSIPFAERTKVSAKSPQQAIFDTIYKILCKELKPLHKKCEANLPGCQSVASDIHHRRGRKGILLILSAYFGYMCRNCHSWCTHHSKEAKALGLSLAINNNEPLVILPREQELIERFKARVPHNVNIISN